MLRNQAKISVFRGIFLLGGWGLGFHRFYEGDKKGVFFQSLFLVLHFLALSFLSVQFMNMLRVRKIVQIIPLIL